MVELTVTLCTHHFVVHLVSPRGRAVVDSFASKYIRYGFPRFGQNRNDRVKLEVYAAATKDRLEYRFHINQLSAFKKHLEYSHFDFKDAVVYKTKAVPIPIKIILSIFPNWKPWPDQLPVLDYLYQHNPTITRTKLVTIQPGGGKSYCTLEAIKHFGYRTLMVFRSEFIDKWLIDIRKTCDVNDEDIITVNGGKQLMALIAHAKGGHLKAKIIMISSRTLQIYISLYEKMREEILDLGFDCLPQDLCETLGVGIRVIDEVHKDFHFQFKLDLYTNVEMAISLSASLLADNWFVTNMQEIAYPKELRYQGGELNKYVSSTAVIYRLKRPNSIRCKNKQKMYSHNVFEQSVMKDKDLLQNYCFMILKVIKNSYLVDHKKGQRLLVYGASIEFCTVLTKYLKGMLPNFDVRRYVEDDPYENLMEAEICVSTLLSAGTGHDIPNLTTVLLTVAVNSTQSNIQGFGRLRDLKLPDVVVKFLYLVCEDVPKHVEYHDRKMKLLEERSKSVKRIFISELM